LTPRDSPYRRMHESLNHSVYIHAHQTFISGDKSTRVMGYGVDGAGFELAEISRRACSKIPVNIEIIAA